MPRTGPAYPISDEWRVRVRAAINAMRDDDGKQMSDAAFARLARVSKASLSEALSPDSTQTTIMPHIHDALGWPAPLLVVAPERLELLAQWDAMDDFERGRMLERARTTVQRLRDRSGADRRTRRPKA